MFFGMFMSCVKQEHSCGLHPFVLFWLLLLSGCNLLYSFVLQGLSFLEMKYHMLLSYLINLTYVVLRKCSGKMIEGDPAIGMLLAFLLTCDLHINICTVLTCLCNFQAICICILWLWFACYIKFISFRKLGFCYILICFHRVCYFLLDW